MCISSPIFPNELILTENICKFISNLAWDSVGSSSKHHGFIHVEMSACSYVYMHITTNSPFLCPIFPATGRTKQVVMQSLCRTSEAVSPFRLSPGFLLRWHKHIRSHNVTHGTYCQSFPFSFFHSFEIIIIKNAALDAQVYSQTPTSTSPFWELLKSTFFGYFSQSMGAGPPPNQQAPTYCYSEAEINICTHHRLFRYKTITMIKILSCLGIILLTKPN